MIDDSHKLIIAVYNDGSPDILHLDLSFLNLKFYDLKSKDFQDHVNSFHYYYPKSNEDLWNGIPGEINYKETMYYHIQHKSPGGYKPNLYALVPIDMSKPVEESVFKKVEDVIKIIFPTNFHLSNLIYYEQEDEKFKESLMTLHESGSNWFIKPSFSRPSDFKVTLQASEIGQVNNFLREAYIFIDSTKDFQLAIESYSDAFSQRSPKMAYVCLCIAMEALVNSEDGEITYKICRTAGVINANSKEEGEIIFQNTKNFYKLRSRILHGSLTNYDFFSDYYVGLRSLVSRTLIEAISLKIQNKDSLNRFVYENGFGDKFKMSASTNSADLNKRTVEILLHKVANYKDVKREKSK